MYTINNELTYIYSLMEKWVLIVETFWVHRAYIFINFSLENTLQSIRFRILATEYTLHKPWGLDASKRADELRI